MKGLDLAPLAFAKGAVACGRAAARGAYLAGGSGCWAGCFGCCAGCFGLPRLLRAMPVPAAMTATTATPMAAQTHTGVELPPPPLPVEAENVIVWPTAAPLTTTLPVEGAAVKLDTTPEV